ncbi:MAG: hypothetical protein CFK52_05845 [Chloracidobacterium sp. CP2_5A]|nr:MAG: hypothetical protein CFK52_05845 [Chloracidobacterium sp. CP2_5A]
MATPPGGVATAQSAPQKIVTAAQVNGTWQRKDGSAFKILALGRQRLRVSFDGIYEYRLPDGAPTANIGVGEGVAFIEGDTATFNPMGGEDLDCKIRMRFAKGKLIVTQEGVCGFGHNVTAAGVYRRVSAAKPKFDPVP